MLCVGLSMQASEEGTQLLSKRAARKKQRQEALKRSSSGLSHVGVSSDTQNKQSQLEAPAPIVPASVAAAVVAVVAAAGVDGQQDEFSIVDNTTNLPTPAQQESQEQESQEQESQAAPLNLIPAAPVLPATGSLEGQAPAISKEVPTADTQVQGWSCSIS